MSRRADACGLASPAAAIAARQGALLAALHGAPLVSAAGLAEAGERLQQGLAAYRSNAQAVAERALQASYPTVHALVGQDDFAAVARALWLAAPPERGDLAQWGGGLAAFIEAEADFDEWPYLGDCARLDAAIQRCESSADATLERDSLALLAERAPEAVRLVLLPCIQLLASRWPVATVHAAHAHVAQAHAAPTDPPGPATDAEDPFAAARAALAAGRAEAVIVARSGWRAVVHHADAGEIAWMLSLQRGESLALALAAAGDTFDFSAWLVRALEQGWLWRAEPTDPTQQKE